MSGVYTKNSFGGALPWIIVLLGLIAFLVGVFFPFENDSYWKTLFLEAGKTLLASGVFAYLLKYTQFLGIFKEEITKIIFEPKFLQNRNDIDIYWGKVTEVLFKDRFPHIRRQLLDDVRNTYLPTNQNYYYDKHTFTYQIELLDNNRVKITQESKVTKIVINDAEHIKYKFVNSIKFRNDQSEVLFKLVDFKVNGEKSIPVVNREVRNNNELVSSFLIDLKGKDKYALSRTIEKEYCLEDDNKMSFRVNYITNTMRLKFHYPQNLKLSFFSLGTLDEFEIVDQKPGFLEMFYDNLIYSNQGFLVIMEKIN